MRLIDAAEVIKAVDKHTFETKDGLCLDDDISIILEDVPTIEERKWIPCSERLPEKYGDYLVTTHNGQIARYIFIGESSEEYWRRCATAWMPLPEPYEEKDNERA